MADWTDRQVKILENRIGTVYTAAERDLDEMIDHYYNGWTETLIDDEGNETTIRHKGLKERYVEEEAAYRKGAYSDPNGVYTDEEMFARWFAAQEGRGQHWIAMRDQMAERLTQANEIAARYINDQLPAVYTNGTNEVATLAQASAMEQGVTGVRFDLVDEYAVRNLMMKKQTLFPFRKVAIDHAIDTTWNRQKLTNAITQGLLGGLSISHIADKLQAVEVMSRTSAIRNARTAVTAAHNGGKQDRMDDLASQGVEMSKVWEDVHDSTPVPEREAHWNAHLQSIPHDQPFTVGGERLMFPGDRSLGASGWNIYNCRCRMRAGGFKFKSQLAEEERKKINIFDTTTQQIVKYGSYHKAETIEEAERLAALLTGGSIENVSYKGLTLQTANMVNLAISGFNDRFDVPKINGVKALKFPPEKTAYAMFNRKKNMLLLNINKMRDADETRADIERKESALAGYIAHPYSLIDRSERDRIQIENGVISGRLVVPRDVYGVVFHELGHYMYSYTIAADFDIDESFRIYSAGLSGYSVVNSDEYHAESFVSYMLGEDRIDPQLEWVFEGMRKRR